MSINIPSKAIQDLIGRIIYRIEAEAPEHDMSPNIRERFQNEDPSRDFSYFAISYRHMPPSTEPNPELHILEVSAYASDGSYKCDIGIAYGNKQKILSYMRRPEFLPETYDHFAKVVQLIEEA